jgi:hypothetical protein
MKKNFLMMALVCLFTVVAVSSCEKDDKEKDAIAVTEVTLNETTLTLAVDSSATLTATVKPDEADDKTVTWTTSDSTKVTVANGIVTAVAKGTATITATAAGGKSATCTVTVTSSSSNIEGILTVTVEDGSSFNGKIDSVKVGIYGEEEDSYYVMTSAPYSNGGFTLNLPETVSDTYLSELGDLGDSITVSNLEVKGAIVNIRAYKADDDIGRFYHGTGTADEDWESDLMYSNSDVSITGSDTSTSNWEDSDGVHTDTYIKKYNVHLKKGWNIVYSRETEKGNNTHEEEKTTIAPSDAKWYYSGKLLPGFQGFLIFSSKRK